MDIRTVYAVRRVISVEISHRTVRHFRCLGNQADYIHTESVDTFIAPPGHHIEDIFADIRVVPVKVRLFSGEKMEVIHAGCIVVLPCRTAETRSPVVRRRLFVFPLPPDIVITVYAIFCFAAFHKPFVFVGGVVYDQIHDDTKSSLVSL